MSDDLSASIQELRDSALSLNTATNVLNEAIQRIERLLGTEFHIGIPAYQLVDKILDEDGGETITKFLGYAKVGSSFRIVVHWCSSFEDVESMEKPWSDCTRDEKAETAMVLPNLIQLLNEKVSARKESITTAARTAVGVLASLSEKEA